MSVSTNIRNLREQSRMTQGELANKLGVARSTVTQWENGWSSPRMGMVQKLATFFDVSTADVVADDVRPANTAAPIPSSTSVPLRVLGVTCMGDGDEDEADRAVEVPAFVVANHPRMFVVHGIGSCMDRRFPADSALGVDPEMEPRNDDAVLVRDGVRGSFVHVYLRGSAGTVMLSADSWSGSHEDIVIGPDDPPIEILGVVVWHQAYRDVVR